MRHEWFLDLGLGRAGEKEREGEKRGRRRAFSRPGPLFTITLVDGRVGRAGVNEGGREGAGREGGREGERERRGLEGGRKDRNG